MDFEVAVVLPAGGTRQRMKSVIPKQFIEVEGKPILCYAIEVFESIPWINCIVLSVAKEWKEDMLKLISDRGYRKVLLADGMPFRHKSIFSGIQMMEKNPPEVVIIHDAVRPFVDVESLQRTVEAAMHYGAAGLIRPLTSTVLSRDKDGFLASSLDRSQYFNSEMPQAFKYDIIHEAYTKCSDYDFEFGTECLHLAVKYANARPKLIDGPDCLWKVTHQRDIHAMKAAVQEHTRRHAVVLGNNCLTTESLMQRLEERGFKVSHVKTYSETSLITAMNNMSPCSSPSTTLTVVSLEPKQKREIHRQLTSFVTRSILVTIGDRTETGTSENDCQLESGLSYVICSRICVSDRREAAENEIVAIADFVCLAQHSNRMLIDGQRIDLTSKRRDSSHRTMGDG